MAPAWRAALLLLLILPASAGAARVPAEVLQAARKLFRAHLRSQGTLHILYQEAVAAAGPGEAVNHGYEKLLRAAWNALEASGQQQYIDQATADHAAAAAATAAAERAAGRGKLQEALARGACSSQGDAAQAGPTRAVASGVVLAPDASSAGVPGGGGADSDTVPGSPPGYPAAHSGNAGASPAAGPSATPLPSVFGAFLHDALSAASQCSSCSSNHSSSSSSSSGSPLLSPVPDTVPPGDTLLPAAHAGSPDALPEGPPPAGPWALPGWGAGLWRLTPALLAAVQAPPAEVLAAWLGHPSLGPPLASLVQTLADAPPAPASDVVHVLGVLAAAAPSAASPAALAAAAVFGRLGRPLSLSEAIETSLLGEGLLDPIVAEALLVVYGWAAEGPVATLLGAYQSQTQPPLAPAAPAGAPLGTAPPRQPRQLGSTPQPAAVQPSAPQRPAGAAAAPPGTPPGPLPAFAPPRQPPPPWRSAGSGAPGFSPAGHAPPAGAGAATEAERWLAGISARYEEARRDVRERDARLRAQRAPAAPAGPSGAGPPPPLPGRPPAAGPPASLPPAGPASPAAAAPPAPCGASRRSRRSGAQPPGGASPYQRGVPPRADGRALVAAEILRLAASHPPGAPFYTRGE